MKRIVLVGLVSLLLLVAAAIGRIVVRSGMLLTLTPHRDVECRAIDGVVGAEDVTIDPRTQIAYLSSDDRRKRMAGTPVRGEIYGLDLQRPDAVPVPLTGGQPVNFHPHGISLWRDPAGGARLFVINHLSTGKHEVVIYQVEADRLQMLERVSYPEMTAPNDLVAVGPRQFYATNDRGYDRGTLMGTLEALLQLPTSSVSFFDGTHGSLALGGIAFANGINVGDGGRTVYVAACLGRAVGIYERDAATGALLEKRRIDLPACPDNIEVDDAGTLWIGAHPKLFSFIEHSEDPTVLSPTQVFRIDPASGRVDEVLLDDGSLLSGTATAAVAGEHMVLGPVFDPKALVCQRPR